MQSLAKETPHIYFGGHACGRSVGHDPGHLLRSARALDILWMITFMSKMFLEDPLNCKFVGHHWSPSLQLMSRYFFKVRSWELLEVSRSQQDSIIIQGEQTDGGIGIDLSHGSLCELLVRVDATTMTCVRVRSSNLEMACTLTLTKAEVRSYFSMTLLYSKLYKHFINIQHVI